MGLAGEAPKRSKFAHSPESALSREIAGCSKQCKQQANVQKLCASNAVHSTMYPVRRRAFGVTFYATF